MKADKFTLPIEQSPDPFCEGDKARDRLEQCEIEIESLKRTINLLTQSVTLLMNLCNKKLNSQKPE